MMATAFAQATPDLEQGHPCFGCAVRQISLCGVLESEALRAYKQTGTTLKVEAGAAIFFEGDPAANVYTLISGTLRLSKLLSDGRRQIAGFLFAGDFLGLTVAEEHAFTAEAITPAVLCRFPRPRFERFLDDHPEMERRLYAIAAHELSAARHQLVLLGRKTATERVVSFLLMLADRCRRQGGFADEIELPMTRTDIADYLGLRIETVSRELSALKAQRLVQFGGTHSVRLLAKDRLRALAEA
jgi:CRP/FNR family transcriptional regulator